MDKGIQEFVAASKIVNQKYPDSYFELLGLWIVIIPLEYQSKYYKSGKKIFSKIFG